jgi:ABC-type ATPase with predicted acetyltransferase domain
MLRVTIAAERPGYGPLSPRAAELMRCFGLDRLDLNEHNRTLPFTFRMAPGQICLLTGPSGTGKTLLLRFLFEQMNPSSRLRLDEIALESDRSVIDCFSGTVEETVRLLSGIGLGDVFALLRPPAHLSTGQQFRYRLLRAVLSGCRHLFVDEFAAGLDGPGAAALAVQTARLIRRRRQILFAATPHEELADYLQPELVIRTNAPAQVQIEQRANSTLKGMPPGDRKAKQAAIRRRGLK